MNETDGEEEREEMQAGEIKERVRSGDKERRRETGWESERARERAEGGGGGVSRGERDEAEKRKQIGRKT